MKELVKGIVITLIVVLVFFLWIHNGNDASNTHISSHEKTKAETSQTEQSNSDDERNTATEPVMVHVTRQNSDDVDLALEAYLSGVVGSEMPASFEMEALKAQCVAARTFAAGRGFQVDDTTSSQVYHDDEQLKTAWKDQYDTYKERIQKALKETEGEILTYEGKPISAVFYSSSCGQTANSEEYWQSASPYLRSVESPWDKDASGYETTVHFGAAEFANKLGFENPVTTIEDAQRYNSGYVNTIRIDQITFTGRMIREKLGLRSSCFTITAVDDGYDVTTKGYGHGLGMSQYGAQGMAKEGYTYQEILLYYYTNVKIEKKYV